MKYYSSKYRLQAQKWQKSEKVPLPPAGAENNALLRGF
jgi:hypothetical protein